MFMDSLAEFCDATALATGGTGRTLIGNVIDLGTPNGATSVTTSTVYRDIGNGKPVYLVITIDTAVTSGGACSVSFELSSDAQAAIAVDASETIHIATTAIAKASLIAGYLVAVVPLPTDGATAYERYLGIVQNVTSNAVTAGKVNAFLTTSPAVWKAYTDGV
jgi:hypothetical protein